ncbi:MAG: hypothetical protein SH820_05670 [Xanthomonadales bacterium]|nr:hypothetical protein [Xanthomonadales bacterium]
MLDSSSYPSTPSGDFVTQHLKAGTQKCQRIQQLEGDLCELAAHIDAAMFRWLELLREFNECEGW